MNRLATLLLLALGALALSTARAASPQQAIDRAVAVVRANPSTTASYTITADGSTTRGTITVCGRSFKIDSPEMKVWYDGTTQWTYLPADAEIDITTPDQAEVNQVNPFAIIDGYKSRYTVRELRSTNSAQQCIELTPRDPAQAGIKKALLYLNASSAHPESLLLTMPSGDKVTIRISSLRSAGPLTNASFRPDMTKMKGVEVVDLR